MPKSLWSQSLPNAYQAAAQPAETPGVSLRIRRAPKPDGAFACTIEQEVLQLHAADCAQNGATRDHCRSYKECIKLGKLGSWSWYHSSIRSVTPHISCLSACCAPRFGHLCHSYRGKAPTCRLIFVRAACQVSLSEHHICVHDHSNMAKPPKWHAQVCQNIVDQVCLSLAVIIEVCSSPSKAKQQYVQGCNCGRPRC